MINAGQIVIFNLLLILFCQCLAGQQSATAANQLLEIGKQIYQQGISSDGTPVKAVVSEDVSVSGEQIACVKCHQKSGLGTSESAVIAWRISGNELYQPRRRSGAWSLNQAKQDKNSRLRSLPDNFNPDDDRVAYNDTKLARALRHGVDSSANMLSPVMPRYDLSDKDMTALITFLKSMSAQYSPGVDATSIRFATVLSDKTDPNDAAAMLDVLNKHIANHNAQTRPYRKRKNKGPFYRSELNTAYRSLELDVWSLSGDQKTWHKQLNNYYQRQPVFAILGGLVEGDWKTIHQFCEQNQIPSIFPITNFPVINKNDWYTLYFSKGAFQQGEAAASYLSTLDSVNNNTEIVQVVSDNDFARRYAQGFSETWKSARNSNFTEHVFTTQSHFIETVLDDRKTEAMIWLLWLDNEDDLVQLTQLLGARPLNGDIYLTSWDLFQTRSDQINPQVAEHLYLTFAHALPNESTPKIARLKQWLKISGIESKNIVIEDKMYFLGWMLSAVLKNMRNDFYRDYFLENFEMMREQNRAIAHFPHVSFAPGQRYIAKGSYIVKHNSVNNTLTKVSDWSWY